MPTVLSSAPELAALSVGLWFLYIWAGQAKGKKSPQPAKSPRRNTYNCGKAKILEMKNPSPQEKQQTGNSTNQS